MLSGRHVTLLLSLLILAAAPLAAQPADAGSKLPQGSLPAEAPAFIENRGQWNPAARYLARLGGMDAWVTDDGIVYDFHHTPSRNAPRDVKAAVLASVMAASDGRPDSTRGRSGHVVRMRFVGAGGRAVSSDADRRETYHNYFYGNDRSKWITRVPLFDEVRLNRLYDGIDARIMFEKGSLRYDMIVEPRHDPSAVRMEFEGALGVRVDRSGDLVIATSLGEVRQRRPIAFQTGARGLQPVECAFAVGKDGGVGFRVDSYNPDLPLVIDPLIYSTFLGGMLGSGYETVTSPVVDSTGQLYVVGATSAPDFPVTPGAYDGVNHGGNINGTDGFLTIIGRYGTNIVSSTFFGSLGDDEPAGVALDTDGDIYIVGTTSSRTFPVTGASFDPSFNEGVTDCFAMKFNATATLVYYSTYIGGSKIDMATGLAVDDEKCLYMMAVTGSSDYPTKRGSFRWYPPYSAGSNPYTNNVDVVISKLNPVGSAYVYSGFLGGANWDYGTAITLDRNKNVIVAGLTHSANFPVSDRAYSRRFLGTQIQANPSLNDAFVAKVSANGAVLMYSTFIGGSASEFVTDAKVDSVGDIHIVGYTRSSDFPATPDAYSRTYHGGTSDIFTVRFDSTGSLLYSSYLGGTGADISGEMQIDSTGALWFVGSSESADYPTTGNAVQNTLIPSPGPIVSRDAILTRLDSAGSAIEFSTFLGGTSIDDGIGLALDRYRMAYVTGLTRSVDFPTTTSAYDTTFNGGLVDIFVSKVGTCTVIADAGPDVEVCRDGSAVIGRDAYNGKPPYTYLWEPADGLSSPTVASPTVTPKGAVDYRVTVTDASGCSTYDIVRVTVTNGPAPVAGKDTIICPGAAVTIGEPASGDHPPFTYSWTPVAGLDNPDSPTPTARPSARTEYVVAVTDARGCVNRDTIIVGFADPLTVTPALNVVICKGGPGGVIGAEASGGVGPYTYSWAPPYGLSQPDAAMPIANPAVATSYVVTVTDFLGCSVSSDPIVVTVADTLGTKVTVVGSAVVCEGDSVTLDAGEHATYLWSEGSTTRTIRAGRAGAYTVAVQDADGCISKSDPVTVTVIPRPDATILGPIEVCMESRGVYSVAEFPGALYEWDIEGTGAVIEYGLGSSRITVLWGSTGSASVSVIVRNPLTGCVDSSTREIKVGTELKPVVLPSGNVTICAGTTMVLDAGDGFDTYEWSTGEKTRTITINYASFAPGVPRTYTVRVAFAGGCSGTSDPVTVTPNAPIKVEVTPNGTVPLCSDGRLRLTATPGFAGYLWSNGMTGESIVVDAPGEYSVTVTDGVGCTAGSQIVNVTPTLPVVVKLDPGGDLLLCEGERLVVRAPAGYSRYLWSTGATADSIVVATAGEYWVTVTTLGGCPWRSDTARVTAVPAPPKPSFTRSGDTLIATPAPAYQWLRNGVEISGATDERYIADASGRYEVRIATPDGCTATSDAHRIGINRFVRLDTTSAAVGDRLRLRMTVDPPLAADEEVRGFLARIRVVPNALFPHRVISPDAAVAGEPAQLTYRTTGEIRVERETTSNPLAGSTLFDLELEGLITGTPFNDVVIEEVALDLDGSMPVAGNGLVLLSGCQIAKGYGKRVRIDGVTPNPAASEAAVSYRAPVGSYGRLRIMDLTGAEVKGVDLDAGTGELQNVRIGLEGLSGGTYLLELRDGEEVVGVPLIIMH